MSALFNEISTSRRAYPARCIWLALALSAGPAHAQQPTADEPVSKGVAVYALSRGKGVPAETRDVLAKVLAYFEKQRTEQRVLSIMSERVGLEGERRVCAEFADQKFAITAYERVLALAGGVELLKVAIEPCNKTLSKKGEKL